MVRTLTQVTEGGEEELEFKTHVGRNSLKYTYWIIINTIMMMIPTGSMVIAAKACCAVAT